MKTRTFEKAQKEVKKSRSTPLASWNEGHIKNSILDFIRRTTDESSDDYQDIENRIAVIDNDGTLWTEYPFYTQFHFLIDRLKELSPQHPKWKNEQPFKGILEGDIKTALAGGLKDIEKLLMVTHAGMATEEFNAMVTDWISKTMHPKFNKPYNECIYHPMLELISYFKSKQFKVYIVSGGGIEFMRPWIEEAYGIPPEQVIGSSIKTKYEMHNGKPVLIRLPEINFVDDKEGKPVGIHEVIGKKPIVAIGNSDGDYQMLEWVTTGSAVSLGIIIHHDDSEREFAYDRNSMAGKLDKALNDADFKGWHLVSMKNDWKIIF